MAPPSSHSISFPVCLRPVLLLPPSISRWICAQGYSLTRFHSVISRFRTESFSAQLCESTYCRYHTAGGTERSSNYLTRCSPAHGFAGLSRSALPHFCRRASVSPSLSCPLLLSSSVFRFDLQTVVRMAAARCLADGHSLVVSYLARCSVHVLPRIWGLLLCFRLRWVLLWSSFTRFS